MKFTLSFQRRRRCFNRYFDATVYDRLVAGKGHSVTHAVGCVKFCLPWDVALVAASWWSELYSWSVLVLEQDTTSRWRSFLLQADQQARDRLMSISAKSDGWISSYDGTKGSTLELWSEDGKYQTPDLHLLLDIKSWRLEAWEPVSPQLCPGPRLSGPCWPPDQLPSTRLPASCGEWAQRQLRMGHMKPVLRTAAEVWLRGWSGHTGMQSSRKYLVTGRSYWLKCLTRNSNVLLPLTFVHRCLHYLTS